MTAVLLALAAGLVLGLSGLTGPIPPRWWDVATAWTLRVLLFLMGLRLGLDPQVGAGLGALGGRAALFAVATAGGAFLAGVVGTGLAAALGGRRAASHGRAGARAGRAMQPPEGAGVPGGHGVRPVERAWIPAGHRVQPAERAGIPAGRRAGEGTPPLGGVPGENGAMAPGPGAGRPGEAVPAAAGTSDGTSALRLSAAAVLAVAGGWLAGFVLFHLASPASGPAGPAGHAPVAAAVHRLATAGSGYALLLLMALFGGEFGRQWPSTRASLGAVRGRALLLPLLGGLGSLAGGWLAGAVAGEPAGLSLAVAAAFGWYSMAGVLVAQLWGPAAGALAFLANVLRELLTVVAVPLLVRRLGRRAWLAVLPGGATTMDTTLPVIAAAARDAGTTALAFIHGLVLTLLAPALIAWLAARSSP